MKSYQKLKEDSIVNNSGFLLALTIGAYILGVWVKDKTKTKLTVIHPLLICVPVIIAIVKVFDIPVKDYLDANKFITFFLGPCVVSLGLILYDNINIIKKNLLPIAVSVLSGSIVGVISVWGLGRLCGMEDTLIVSVEPKSITTPIAVELSKVSGGVVGITAVSVTLCGMLGASLGPTILNLFKIKNPIARGSAIGCASHGIGTSRALEESAVEGAISGLCIALMGVATSVLMPIFNELIGI